MVSGGSPLINLQGSVGEPSHECVRTGVSYECSCSWHIEGGTDVAKCNALTEHILRGRLNDVIDLADEVDAIVAALWAHDRAALNVIENSGLTFYRNGTKIASYRYDEVALEFAYQRMVEAGEEYNRIAGEVISH